MIVIMKVIMMKKVGDHDHNKLVGVHDNGIGKQVLHIGITFIYCLF